MNKRIAWIDYLKFVACIMVMIFHFCNTFFVFCSYAPNLNDITIGLFEYFPKPFLDGNFWVCVFCALSGVLTAKKEISSLKKLVRECIMRYVRFFLPLLISNFIVFLIGLSVGFQNHSFAQQYGNVWLDGYFYNISIGAVVKNSVLFGSNLNGPLWMLKPLFIGNILILVTNYLLNRFERLLRYKYVCIILASVSMLATSFIKGNVLYVFVTYFGLLLYSTSKERHNAGIFALLVLVTILGNYIPKIDSLMTIHSLPLKNVLLSIIFVYAFLNWKRANSIAYTHDKLPLGAISFWVYLLHWPIICSFSCFLISRFSNYTLGFWIDLLVTLVVVCLISYVAVNTIDKIVGVISSKIGKIMQYILRDKA